MKKYPFNEIHRTSAANAVTDLTSVQVRPNEIKCVQFAVMRDKNNALTTIDLMKTVSGLDVVIERKSTLAAGDTFVHLDDHYLTEGQSLFARFTTPTLNDELTFYLEGWYARVDYLGDGTKV